MMNNSKKVKIQTKNVEKESVFTYHNIKIEDKLSIPLWIFGLAAFILFVYLNVARKEDVSWQYVTGAVLSGFLFLYEIKIFLNFISKRRRKVGDFAATLTHDELIYVNRNDASQEMHHIDVENIEKLDIENNVKDIYADILVKLKDQSEPIILHDVYKPKEVLEVFEDFRKRSQNIENN